MVQIVRDDGFHTDDLNGVDYWPSKNLADIDSDGIHLDLDGSEDATTLAPYFSRISVIRIVFLSFQDGRGFSLAQRLRRLGYNGRMRATGSLISDQYSLARRSGFDEIEISDQLAVRQTEEQWKSTHSMNYQSRIQRR